MKYEAVNYVGKIDKECLYLCDIINKLPGIYTIESCCGHGKEAFHIWFKTKGLKYLPNLLYWFDGCHCGYYGWEIRVETDCAKSPVTFLIEGPSGEEAYQQATEIANLIERYEVNK